MTRLKRADKRRREDIGWIALRIGPSHDQIGSYEALVDASKIGIVRPTKVPMCGVRPVR